MSALLLLKMESSRLSSRSLLSASSSSLGGAGAATTATTAAAASGAPSSTAGHEGLHVKSAAQWELERALRMHLFPCAVSSDNMSYTLRNRRLLGPERARARVIERNKTSGKYEARVWRLQFNTSYRKVEVSVAQRTSLLGSTDRRHSVASWSCRSPRCRLLGASAANRALPERARRRCAQGTGASSILNWAWTTPPVATCAFRCRRGLRCPLPPLPLLRLPLARRHPFFSQTALSSPIMARRAHPGRPARAARDRRSRDLCSPLNSSCLQQ